MKTIIIKQLLTIILVAILGCSCSKKSETNMGNHFVVVIPGSTITTKFSITTDNNNEVHKYTCGKTSITIHNEQLTVNDKNYGMLTSGARIVIDNGKVFVSSKERKSIPLQDTTSE